MSDIGENARDLHSEVSGWDTRNVSPMRRAHADADKRWRELLDVHARNGGRSPLLWAPDELARHVESQVHVMRQNGWASNTTDWASLVAFCLAGWCAADMAEELRVDTGEAA